MQLRGVWTGGGPQHVRSRNLTLPQEEPTLEEAKSRTEMVGRKVKFIKLVSATQPVTVKRAQIVEHQKNKAKILAMHRWAHIGSTS